MLNTQTHTHTYTRKPALTYCLMFLFIRLLSITQQVLKDKITSGLITQDAHLAVKATVFDYFQYVFKGFFSLPLLPVCLTFLRNSLSTQEQYSVFSAKSSTSLQHCREKASLNLLSDNFIKFVVVSLTFDLSE